MFKRKTVIALSTLLSMSSAMAELRDPTIPGNLPQQEFISLPSSIGVTDLKLNSIWISKKSRRAIINGTPVKAGELLPDGSQVLKIHSRYVLVRQNGSNKKLFLVPSVKNPVK